MLVLLSAMFVVAGMKPETHGVKPFVDRLMAVLGLLILVASGAYLVNNWATLDKADLALSFVPPIWLTVVALPFIFLFSVLGSYEESFVQINFFAKDNARVRRRAKLALATTYWLRNRELHRFGGMGPQDLARAESWGEARRVVAFQRAQARLDEAENDLAVKRLARYAGVQGEDWQGQPYDQREFVETKEALDRLHMFQRAQYQQRRRYNPDLPVGSLVAQKLPAEHGIG